MTTQPILDYIQKARAAGQNDDQFRAALTQAGWATIKDAVANSLERFIYHQTQRSPLVLPVIIET